MAFDTTIPCRGIAGWLFGHCFESRFDQYTETHPKIWESYPEATSMSIPTESLKPDIDKTTYHGDVCERCGQTVNKPILTP